jgi:hypothetical protein
MGLPIRDFDLPLRDGTRHSFSGMLLGSGSSARSDKSRWFEVAIYIGVDGTFILHTAGLSTVADEKPRYRLVVTQSAFEVVDRLIVHHDDKIYIPSQSMRALAAAAQWNDDLLEAFREVPTMLNARRAGEANLSR